MNPEDAQRDRQALEIFGRAVEMASAEARRGYLEGACGGDERLKARVEALLAHHVQDNFLQQPAAVLGPGATVVLPIVEKPGDRIGRYKLLQQIGEGGCGVVYMAEQEEPVRRRVALKVIKLGMDTNTVIARFEAERQALALMDHPNIAKVLDAGGTETGRPFFVMELVRGIKITEYCDQNNLPTRERLDLFIQVCHAIQHAHQKGIIHRDIKPSNILVSLHDGVPVPVVIDFGIAKATEQRLTDKTLFTAFEQFIGTPAYTSPEQAEMSRLDIDTRSDIYSLGVLLYELLTSKTPLDSRELLAAGLDEMRRAIREKEPARPSTRLNTLKGDELTTTAKRRGTEAPKLIHLVRGDLDWIVMKCLEKDRTRRYETANGLATDIERHLKHEPVVARPPSTAYRMQKFVRRNKVMVTAAGLVAAAMVLGVMGSTWQAIVATRAQGKAQEALESEAVQRQKAVEAEAKEAQQREEAEAQAYAADINLAQHALLAGDLGKAQRVLDRYRPGTGREHLRGFEWRYLASQTRSDAAATDTTSTETACGLALSPDGRTLAVIRVEGSIELRDPATLQVKRRLESKGQYGNLVAFSPEGNLLAGTAEGGFIRLWRSDTLELTRELSTSNYVLSLSFAPNGRQLAAFTKPGVAWVWDLESGQLKRQYRIFRTTWDAGAICYSPDGRHLAVGDASGRICILDSEGDRVVTNFPAHDQGISCLAYSPDAQLLASGSGFEADSIRLWNPLTGEPMGRLEGHKGWVSDVEFSSDGQRLASSSADQTIRIWDVTARKPLRTLRGHTEEVWSVALGRDGDSLFSVSKDGAVARWGAGTEHRRDSLVELPKAGLYSWLLGDGRTVAALRADGAIMIYDVSNEPQAFVLEVLGTNNSALAVAPRSGLLASINPDGVVGVWSLRKGSFVAQLAPEGAWPWLTFSGGENRFIAIDDSKPGEFRVRNWDTTAWKEAQPIVCEGLPAGIGIAISPDGRFLVHGTLFGWVLWYDLQTGRKLSETKAHGHAVVGMAFSADGSCLATTSEDATVALWDVETHQRTAHWKAMAIPSVSRGAAISPDGRRLAIGQGMGVGVRLWDLKTRRELATLPAAGNFFQIVQFSADGDSLLAVPIERGPCCVWRPPSLAELDGDAPAVVGGRGEMMELALKLEPPPRIERQPEPVLVEAGGTAEFRVQVAGKASWTCQWQHDGVDLPGATNTVLRLQSVSGHQAGEYRARIGSAIRPEAPSAVSQPASLCVREGNLLCGELRLETYLGIPGLLVSDLTNHHKFPDQPDSIETIGRFETTRNRAEDYGTRLTGYLIPPVTGDYIFHIASDDQSILFLSSDEDATHKRAIACEASWSWPRQWRKPESPGSAELGKVSAPVNLEAGRRYYVEVLHKEATFRDHLAVAWQLPGQPAPRDSDPPIPGRYLACREPQRPVAARSTP